MSQSELGFVKYAVKGQHYLNTKHLSSNAPTPRQLIFMLIMFLNNCHFVSFHLRRNKLNEIQLSTP